jgi:hypothetical protein
MIVYTLLFTLSGKNPCDNQYIQMFQIWLSYIIKYACLDKSDKIYVLIDTVTSNYIDTNIQIDILKKTTCPITFIQIQQPTSISEGMVKKYIHFEDKDTFLYLDLDVLVIKSLKEIPSLQSNQLLVVPEGIINHGLYAGHLLPESIEPICGFTAGLFGYYPGEEITKFFESIRSECLNYKEVLYTVDQPFFNKWLYLTITQSALKITLILMKDKVTNNSTEEEPGVVFLNYPGQPGDGQLHYTKMMNKMCLDFISLR